jgi:tetratricopeptide (TPR) repeat protein
MLKEMMDNAAKRIESGSLRQTPEAEIQLRLSIGAVYDDLAQFEAAERILKPALQISPVSSQQSAASLRTWAVHLKVIGKSDEAYQNFSQSIDLLRKTQPGDSLELALALANLGELQNEIGRFADAERTNLEALEMSQRILSGDREEVADCLQQIATSKE